MIYNEDKFLEKLLNLHDEDFANYLLREDLLYYQIKNKDEIIKKSLETGFEIAEKLKKESFNFDNFISEFNFEITEEATANEFNFYELAAFEEPNKIIFFKDNINRIKKEIEKEIDIIKKLDVKKIILAHELYHKLEEIYKLYTDSVYISYIKFKFINKKSKILSASEIGAMSFAKNILDMKINPLIINYLLARTYNKEKIIYDKIVKGR